MFIAIYSKDPFPQDDSRIVNSEPLSTIEDCQAFFVDARQCHSLGVWNTHIYDLEKQEYIHE